MQKKFSYISKHRNEAKEQWLCTQEKLKHGVKDSETEKIMETALLAKNLLGKKKKQLSKPREKSMVLLSSINDSEITTRQKDDKKPNLLEKIEKNLESTRNFIKKMEKCKETIKDPSKMLQKLEELNEKRPEEAKPKPEQPVMDKEILPYFQSLNKIEDTIRFLENNIKETKENQIFPMATQKLNNYLSPEAKTITQKMENLSTVSQDMRTFFLSPDNPLAASIKEGQKPQSRKEEEKDECEEEPSFWRRANEKKDDNYKYEEQYEEHSLKKTFRNEEERENLPISFDITAKSKSFDEDLDNQRDSLLHSLIRQEELQIQKLNPEMFFKNVESHDGNDSDKENWNENVHKEEECLKPAKVIFSEIEGKKLKQNHQNVEDDEDYMIEKIKNMLENTKTELTKMNQINFDFPNYQILGGEAQPMEKIQKKESKNECFFENIAMKKRNEKILNVEPCLKTLNNSNFNVKIHNSITNNVRIGGNQMFFGQDEEEIPLPRKLNVVKTEERKTENLGSKMFKKSGDSLNIKSFLK